MSNMSLDERINSDAIQAVMNTSRRLAELVMATETDLAARNLASELLGALDCTSSSGVARNAARYMWVKLGVPHRVDCTNKKGKAVTYFIGARNEAEDFGDKLDAAIDTAMAQR